MWAEFLFISYRCGGPIRQYFSSPYDRTFSGWCQGQDSNLRSPSGQRFYRPSVLATHPPWLESPVGPGACSIAAPGYPFGACPKALEPEGGFEPSTYRLQIGCAAVAP